jgi:hypothetical protein
MRYPVPGCHREALSKYALISAAISLAIINVLIGIGYSFGGSLLIDLAGR